jgi:hypothetical protein
VIGVQSTYLTHHTSRGHADHAPARLGVFFLGFFFALAAIFFLAPEKPQHHARFFLLAQGSATPHVVFFFETSAEAPPHCLPFFSR